VLAHFPPHVRLFHGDGFDFFVGGVALKYLLNAVLQQCGHAFGEGGMQHVFRTGFLLDQAFHVIGADQ